MMFPWLKTLLLFADVKVFDMICAAIAASSFSEAVAAFSESHTKKPYELFFSVSVSDSPSAKATAGIYVSTIASASRIANTLLFIFISFTFRLQKNKMREVSSLTLMRLQLYHLKPLVFKVYNMKNPDSL